MCVEGCDARCFRGCKDEDVCGDNLSRGSGTLPAATQVKAFQFGSDQCSITIERNEPNAEAAIQRHQHLPTAICGVVDEKLCKYRTGNENLIGLRHDFVEKSMRSSGEFGVCWGSQKVRQNVRVKARDHDAAPFAGSESAGSGVVSAVAASRSAREARQSHQASYSADSPRPRIAA